MANEKINLDIDSDYDASGVNRARKGLMSLLTETEALDKALGKIGLQTEDLDAILNRFGKTAGGAAGDTDELGKASTRTSGKLKGMQRVVQGFFGILKKGYILAMKGAGIETLALAAALSAVNGLLIAGRFLAKAYQIALSGIAKGAAVAVAALATLAAAQRQFAAASSAGRYGGDFRASSTALRGMTGDARLATVGMKGLTQAFAAASKNAKVTGATGSAIAGLLDFAYLSGDVEKGTTSIANLISLIQKGEGLSSSAVTGAAKELGPEFEKAYKEITAGGKMTSEELIKIFSSGEFAKKAGIAGSASAVQGSLMGQLKAFMTNMQVMFGDFGQNFIEPFQAAFEEIRRIMVRTFTSLTPIVNEYVQGGLIDKFVSGIDKISQFIVKFMGEYVPRSEGFFDSVSGFFDKIKSGFNAFNAYLRRFSEASKIVNKFFGGILGAIGKGLKTNFENFAENVVENKDNFLEFGDSIENLIRSIFELFRKMRDAFMKALPSINKVVDAVSFLVDRIGNLVSIFSTLGGVISAPFKKIPGVGGTVGGGLEVLTGLGGPLLLLSALSGKGAIGKGSRRLLGKGAKKLGKSGGKFAMNNAAALGLLAGGYVLNESGFGGDIVNDSLVAGMYGAGGAMMLGVPGKYAGAAGLGIGGSVMAFKTNDELADLAYRKSGGNRFLATTAGIGSGAVTGAALGAALTMFGGPTAAIGAAIGAVIGGIVGGIQGFLQDSKYKKRAKKAAGEFVKEYAGIMDNALAGNNLDVAKKGLEDFDMYAKQFAQTQVKSGTALKEANKKWDEELKRLEPSVKLMESRFKDLEHATGLTSEEIAKLANQAEISLANGMMTLQDVFEATGIATRRFGQEFSDALKDAYANAVAGIRTSVEILNAPNVANEAAITYRQKALAGVATAEDTAALLEALAQEQLLYSGGDPLKAFMQLFTNIGTPTGKQFTTFEQGKFGVLSDLSVIDAIFNNPDNRFIFDQFFGAAGMGGQTSGLAAENIVSMLAGKGLTGGTVEGITGSLNQLLMTNPAEYFRIINAVSSGEMLTAMTTVTPYGAMPGTTETYESQLAKVLGPEFMKNLELQKTNEQMLRDTLNDASLAFVQFNSPDSTFNTSVEKFGQAVDLLIEKFKDTASPRRNTVKALSAHGAFDSQIAGKRTITSGYRNFALGSMDSDHAAGRAYDLVGQNLGLYGQAIRQAGGFAEFHGNGAGRHLHVVPGGVPVGDTASPFIASPIMTPATNNNSTVNVVVNASPGMDVQALANEVMSRIDRAQRSRNERY